MKNFLKCLFRFSINVFAGLIGTGIIALITIYIFKIPNFDIQLLYVSDSGQYVTDPTKANLIVALKNKKDFISFRENEVFYSFIVPTEFVKNKEFSFATPDGWKRENINDYTLASAGGKEYYYIRSINKYALNPNATADLVMFKGNFINDKSVKICIELSTPYGSFPRGVKRDGLVDLNAEINKFKCREFIFPEIK